MYNHKEPHAEPIPGYRLLELLGKGGFGEVWKCEAPGGLFKAIKFISGGDHLTDPTGVHARQELHALQLVKSIRHPFLLSIERIEEIDGEALVVMELADRSLHDLFTEYRAAGKEGIPRAELLEYLREAAEAIDVLNEEYGLQHLDIKPRNLFLIGRHVKVADFGLVISLSDVQTQASWRQRSEAVTPLYAAPEAFLGRFTPFSDQYSLAVTYQELRTGTLPFTGRNYRQLALRHVQDSPDLKGLPEAERPVLARALAKEPPERYPSCRAFVQALRALSDVAVSRPQRMHGAHTDLKRGERVTSASRRRGRARQPAKVAAPLPRGEGSAESDTFLAGYRLLECLHRHSAAEVWKAQTSDGRKRLVKLINGYDAEEERPGGDPLARLRELRHPCLSPLEIQHGIGSRLALIVEAPDISLADRLRECQQQGQPGVPRTELIDYLEQAAEALDALYQQHRLQHLCLTPRQLVLRDGRLYLLDFALTELLWLPAGHQPAALNMRYAAPELFDQQFSRQGDQYSLALIYQELLTGIHPFRHLNPRQMVLSKLRSKPDLGMLPATDRPIVAQALHIDPDQRFPTCSAFIQGLISGIEDNGITSSHQSTPVQLLTLPASFHGTERRPALVEQVEVSEPWWDCSPTQMKEIVAEQVAAAAGAWETLLYGPLRYRIHRGRRGKSVASAERAIEVAMPALAYFACGRLIPATMQLKLSSFEEEWRVEPVEAALEALTMPGGTIRTASWQYRLRLGGNLWQRWLGRSPGLLVQIDLATPPASTESLSDVIFRVRPCDCRPGRGLQLLEEVGPSLLTSLRDHLQLPPDRRADERIAWVENVQVRPFYSEREIGETLAAQTTDISLEGMGFDLPCYPPCDLLLVQLCPPHRAPLIVPVQGLHAQPRGNSRHHIGARFAWELVPE